MSSSVIPSARYSCVGSPERFFKGSTAIDLIAGAVATLPLSQSRILLTFNATIRMRLAVTKPARAFNASPLRESTGSASSRCWPASHQVSISPL